VALSDVQLAWLSKVAAEQAPPLSVNELLGRIVDDAIAQSKADARQRAERLEVYRASGYSEHHPDYPNVPREAADA
jgi:hypothetical protein